ncbi:MAG: carboxypeptidase-like regulatory domain-containing protein, partial [Myxococcota bacterium]|nr:carboxypeptidase-like regulatory domain-containing protein [Myxococcota bacterium]
MTSPVRVLALAFSIVSCGGDPPPSTDAGTDAPPIACEGAPVLEVGDPEGHPEPLGAGPTEARAGRIDGASLPPFPSGLGVWDEGGFVLANDRVAMVIEDVGPSHLYDPWGGRPLGIARVEGGALVDPADFGEILILTSRYTVMTTSVSVIADGSDGGAAIVRASGPMRPLPFYEAITGSILSTAYEGIDAAIDYVLEPGSSTVDVRMTYASSLDGAVRGITTMHGFMYTPRMPAFAPDVGFDPHEAERIPFLAFTDERGVGFAYADPRGGLGAGIVASGFVSRFTPPVLIRGCDRTESHHARITIGGPGVDALLAARAEEEGTALRTIEGVVRDASGAPASGVRVHAVADDERYRTRSMPTGDDGRYVLHVPSSEAGVRLFAYRQGDALVGPIELAADAT